MNLQALRNALVNSPDHHERPQTVARIDRAIGMLREGLQELASLGHSFYLAEGTEPRGPKWPRLVYHLEKAPRGFLCLCEQDFELLGPGWFDTLDEAKHADGMGEQFKRGGIFPKKGLPAVVTETESTPLDRQRKAGLE